VLEARRGDVIGPFRRDFAWYRWCRLRGFKLLRARRQRSAGIETDGAR
jgi:hypothetical protein